MIFTSFEFLGFFLLVLLGKALLRGFAAEAWFLLVAGCAYYMTWSVPCLGLLLAMCLTDYFVARKMGASSDPVVRRHLLWVSLAANLGLLGFFKYSNFFLGNLAPLFDALGWPAASWHIDTVLPPAISYFTFAGLSYVLDVYYERLPPCASARDYALYVTFFPKLLSGPIMRAREFLPQLKGRLRVTVEDVEVGLGYFLIGAVKKLVVADSVAPHVNLIFASPASYDGPTLLMGALGYTVQIYCDFSGYSDMAIGSARLLGIRVPENFQMPFSAASIAEFWRRWHITLSAWFRDYLFLPLEMATRSNPHPTLRVSGNMMATMLLCGLWHGPSWNFVIWGGIHGAALAAHKAWTVWNPFGKLKHGLAYRMLWPPLAHLLTLGVVVLGMIFFRAQTFADAVEYLGRLLMWAGTGTRLGSPYILGAVIGMIVVHLIVGKDRNLVLELSKKHLVPRVIGYSSMLAALVLLGASEPVPFVYFQF